MNNLASTSHPPINHHTASGESKLRHCATIRTLRVQSAHSWQSSTGSTSSTYPEHAWYPSSGPGSLRAPPSSVVHPTSHSSFPTLLIEILPKTTSKGKTQSSSGKWLAVYSPEGAPFELDLSVLPGHKATANWFNPRNGVTTPAEPVDLNSGAVSVTPPSTGSYEHDWVYYLETTSVHI
jgi:hypothetical protein